MGTMSHAARVASRTGAKSKHMHVEFRAPPNCARQQLQSRTSVAALLGANYLEQQSNRLDPRTRAIAVPLERGIFSAPVARSHNSVGSVQF
jgi:hypothetical protein